MDKRQRYGTASKINEIRGVMGWIKHIGASLLWIPLALFEGVLIAAGFVYLHYLTRTSPLCKIVKSRNKENNGYVVTYHNKVAWFLCGNDEDGIYGPYDPAHPSVREWVKDAKYMSRSEKMRSWWYRNPFANDRYSKLGFDQDPFEMICYGNSMNPWEDWKEDYFGGGVTETYWLWARQGWRCGLWVVTPKYTYRIGAKVYPYIPREADERQGLFTIQRRRNRA